jgi:hypothetical protein
MPVTHRSRIPQLIVRMERASERAVDDTLTDFARRLVEGFQSSKSGNYYSRGGRSLHAPISQGLTNTHHASAPGEYPAIDYGNLVASFEPRKESPTRAVARIGGPRAPYAVILEYGGVRMEARPYWSVSLLAVQGAWDARVRAIME